MNASTTSPTQDLPLSAEDWLARLLSPDCSASDHRAFEDWLAESPRNALDYAEVERLHQLAALLRREPELHGKTPRLATRAPVMRRRRAWHASLAWAAILLLALGGGFWLFIGHRNTAPVQYATKIGELRRVNLPDGSGLFLDTNTLVQVVYEHSQRRVELLSGRVQADVMHDGNRPFVVISGAGSVRALGTVFQVERRNGSTVVSLLEGRVVVETKGKQANRTIELEPLEQVSYDLGGKFEPPKSIDRNMHAGWTQGKLIFKEERLADLIEEFNRYSSNRLILSEAELGDIRVSGVFNAGDQAGLLAALQKGWDLQAKRTSSNQIMLSASK